MILLLENNIRAVISSIMGDGYIKSDENKKTLYIDANNLIGQSMSQPLPFDENIFMGRASVSQRDRDRNVKLEDTLNTPDDSDIGYFVGVDLKNPDKMKEKIKNYPFCPENKISHQDKVSKHMKQIKPTNYTQK